jgi:hypothetical protein
MATSPPSTMPRPPGVIPQAGVITFPPAKASRVAPQGTGTPMALNENPRHATSRSQFAADRPAAAIHVAIDGVVPRSDRDASRIRSVTRSINSPNRRPTIRSIHAMALTSRWGWRNSTERGDRTGRDHGEHRHQRDRRRAARHHRAGQADRGERGGGDGAGGELGPHRLRLVRPELAVLGEVVALGEGHAGRHRHRDGVAGEGDQDHPPPGRLDPRHREDQALGLGQRRGGSELGH